VIGVVEDMNRIEDSVTARKNGFAERSKILARYKSEKLVK